MDEPLDLTPYLAPDVLSGERDTLTSEEAELIAEVEIQHALGMSLEEFRARARAGTLPEHGAMFHLVGIAGVSKYYRC